MSQIIIAGGGWAGCAAAYAARTQGAHVTLLERTDMLLGTGLVGGIMRNNGRYTATEEMIALGGGKLFQIVDGCCRHTNIQFPGHAHASLYDIARTPTAIAAYLLEIGVEIVYKARVTGVQMDGDALRAVETADGRRFSGDVFLDTTGTAGPMNNCAKYGNGCAMCVLRCPSFGGRVSLAGLAGVPERMGRKADGSVGAMSGSCKLYKESLAPEIVAKLDRDGVAVIPLPPELMEDHLSIKACQQYALPAFAENVVLLDTGHAKLMTPYFTLDRLRRIPGFENARYEDPYAGGQGNSMRYFAMAPRDNALQVQGVANLFCAGEKAGPLVGHTEAIVTGVLAGCNAARLARGQAPIVLPRETVVGDAIAFVGEQMETETGIGKKYTFSGSVLFERMQARGTYTTDRAAIAARIQELGLTGVFAG